MNHIYFTVGLSGCGKSYWCDTHAKEHDVILDSDMVRAELWGDASDQQNPSKVFNLMFHRTCIALSCGRDVYYCQTGLTMKHRIRFIKDIRAKYTPDQVQLHCVILVAPIEVCKERNAKRSRHVPDEVIDRQWRQFQIPVENEGWDSITVIPMDYDKDEFFNQQWSAVGKFGTQENKHHSLSLFWHCFVCGTSIGRLSKEIVDAAYIHDFGKLYTKTYWPEKDNDAHYPNHAEVGAYLALCMGYSLYTAQLVGYHMVPYMDARAQETWKNRLGEQLWHDVLIIHDHDRKAH